MGGIFAPPSFYVKEMRRFLYLLFVAVATVVTSTSCDNESDKAKLTATPASLSSNAGEVTLSVEANGTWVISSSETWLRLSKSYGENDDVLTASYAANADTAVRNVTVTVNCGSAMATVSLTQAAASSASDGDAGSDDKPKDNPANKNANPTSAHSEAARLEMPALNADNYFLSHYVTFNNEKVVNYSLEWNNSKKHAQWVAFEFNKDNCAKNVQRSKDFVADPDLPESMRVDNTYHTSDGFDRGHLCASDDRVYSADANAQTFYFSNMSPQFNEFNAGFWQALEAEVQTWGRLTSSGTYDKIYVAKGGTLDRLLVNYVGSNKGQDNVIPKTDASGLTVKGLPCPAYYFMAVLAQKGDTYRAIGFIAPHSQTLTPLAGGENFTVADLKKYAVSVDELESQTGIDFFCNLPDAIEDSVEGDLSLDAWKW